MILAAVGVALLIAAVVRQGLKGGTVPPPPAPAEDALTLYQVAKEYYARGDERTAMTVLGRARKATSSARALEEIEQLEREINLSPRLAHARDLLDQGRIELARAALDALRAELPGNARVATLGRLFDARAGTNAGATPNAGAVSGSSSGSGSGSDNASGNGSGNGSGNEERAASIAAGRQILRQAAAAAVRRSRRSSSSADSAGAAVLRVESEEPGVVSVDGRVQGVTPVVMTVPAGRHVVTFAPQHDASARITRRVAVTAGYETAFRFTRAMTGLADGEPRGGRGAGSADTAEAPGGASQQPASGGSAQPTGGASPTRPRARPSSDGLPSDNLNPWE
ncbi:MAG: hypothetical protein IPL40_06315 [Proteobacteria bacterium]|nr:hypothetical protein [Pseudomonadota bacterium]